jgi:chromosome segregation ATPase
MWQRALALAAQSAKHDDNAARERLAQIRTENDLRAQSFALREKEFESAARSRERALTDCREHVAAMMKMLESDRARLRAKEVHISDLETQLENCRQQLAKIVGRVVARNRAFTNPRMRATQKRRLMTRTDSKPKLKARVALKRLARRRPTRRVAKR